MKTTEWLKILSDAAGVGGETGATQAAADLLRPLVDEVKIDTMGSVLGYRRCADPNAPTLMLEAHLDEIGLIVTGIDDKGFLQVAKCGGVDPRSLQAQPVVVFGKQPVRGMICTTPPHLAGDDKELPDLSDTAVDVGMSKEEAEKLIAAGDRIGFAPNFAVLQNDRVSGKSLDDRAGCAAVLLALDLLKDKPLAVNLIACLAVQEELGGYGAKAAAFETAPDYCVCTDVSFGLTHDAPAHECGELGKGAMLGIGPVLDRAFTLRLKALAVDGDIPVQTEVLGGRTGTDADGMTTAHGGIRTTLLSIPLRYMHTPAELLATADVEAVARLMAAAAEKGVVG